VRHYQQPSVIGNCIGKTEILWQAAYFTLYLLKARASWVLAAVRFVACEASFADYRTRLWVEIAPCDFWGWLPSDHPVHFPIEKGRYPAPVNKIQIEGTTMFKTCSSAVTLVFMAI
jgi:hypothetical protein